jgi:cysteine-rich repeat protein
VIVQTTCGDELANLSCVSYPGVACPEGSCGHVDAVSAGQPLFVVVDGRRTAARAYELELQLHRWAREGEECAEADPARTCRPPQICRAEKGANRCRDMVCGDGIVEGDLFAGLGEECDDGNAAGGDGCSEACTLTTQGPAGDTCADAVPFHVVETHPDLFLQAYGFGASDTTGAAADLEGSCAPSAGSADQVWTIHVDEATPFTAAVAPDVEGYLPILYLLAQEAGTCGATELACATGDEVNRYTTLEIETLEPGTYYLVVDGVDGDAVTEGPYSIEAVFATL